MNILINLSVIHVGGGVQVAHSFLQELKSFPQHRYHVAVMISTAEKLGILNFPDFFTFYTFEFSASQIIKGRKTRLALKTLEKDTCPDVVFTLFGPSYWKPETPHLCGYAIPHHVYPKSPFFKIISAKEYLKWKVLGFIKFRLLRKQCDYFVTETDDVSERLSLALGIERSKVYTVSNSCNGVFNQADRWRKAIDIQRSGFTMITISSFYPHKNLGIIPKVIDYLELEAPELDFTFVLTIQESDIKNLTLKQRKHIRFLGRVSIEDCPYLYEQADALFLPTLLECFSASYLEAMTMSKPILTSDLPFARTICKKAALYFDPLSAKAIGNKIITLARDRVLFEQLVEDGNERLRHYGDAKDRAIRYLEILETIKTGLTSHN